MGFPNAKLDADQRTRAEGLVPALLREPEAAANHIVAMEAYADLLARGLSDHEARGTVWGSEGFAKPEPAEGICGVCGKPMPEGEETFAYHGYSGPCPTDTDATKGEEK